MTRWKNFDWLLFSALFFLSAASLAALLSSSSLFFWRQLGWYIAAFLVIFFGSQIDWRWLIGQRWFRYGLYWFGVILLLITNFQTSTIRGTKSWLILGGFQFEPVEIMKVALILVLAGYFSRQYLAAWAGKNILTSLFYVLIPLGLTALQPDFGSAIILFGIWFGFILMSGINKKRLAIGLIIIVAVIASMWFTVLKDYQKERIVGFFSQERDPFGINYNVIQSKIAIGSAGFLGKGFGEGSQTRLHFLPEAQTDFLFAAFVEEWGILGGLLVILTFIVIMFRLVNIGFRAGNNDSKFIILGCSFVLLIQFFINIGSNLGLVPVIGITFPFFSYGGSSLLTVALMMSIIERIKIESSI